MENLNDKEIQQALIDAMLNQGFAEPILFGQFSFRGLYGLFVQALREAFPREDADEKAWASIRWAKRNLVVDEVITDIWEHVQSYVDPEHVRE